MNRNTADEEARLREIIDAWSSLKDLAKYAQRMHGYGDSDGGFGITYPCDLDDYQREILGENITAGMVQAYGYWGPPAGYEFLTSEIKYLRVLAEVLQEQGHLVESTAIKHFAASRGPKL